MMGKPIPHLKPDFNKIWTKNKAKQNWIPWSKSHADHVTHLDNKKRDTRFSSEWGGLHLDRVLADGTKHFDVEWTENAVFCCHIQSSSFIHESLLNAKQEPGITLDSEGTVC